MNRRSRQTLAASIYGVLSEDGILPSTLPACLRCFMVASCIKIRQLTPREVKVATRTTAAALGGVSQAVSTFASPPLENCCL